MEIGEHPRTRVATAALPVGLLVAVTVAALNLRPTVVAVGPLAEPIQASTGLGGAGTSLLTTLPLVCFGLGAALAPRLGRHLGVERQILLALCLVLAGCVLRLLAPLPFLFAGTIVAASGIAIGNVVVPAAVKQLAADHVGRVMALYSVALQAGAAAAAGLTEPLRTALATGWRPTLALWGVPAVVALGVWLPRARRGRRGQAGHGDDATPAPASPWRSTLGWYGAAFIGLQSAIFFALAAWLPTLLHDRGLSTGRAGLMLSIVGLAGIVGGFPMPILAARVRSQAVLAMITASLFAAGLLLLLGDVRVFALPAAIVLGLAQGSALSLAVTLFTLRTRTVRGAAALSGMCQGAGYLVAALGPLTAGALHSSTGGWTVPVVVLLIAVAPLAAAGVLFARPRTLETGPEPQPLQPQKELA